MRDSLRKRTAGKHWGKSQDNLGGRNENRSRLGNDRENRSGKQQQKKPTKDNMVLQHKKWQAVEHRRALTAQKHEAHSYKHNVSTVPVHQVQHLGRLGSKEIQSSYEGMTLGWQQRHDRISNSPPSGVPIPDSALPGDTCLHFGICSPRLFSGEIHILFLSKQE